MPKRLASDLHKYGHEPWLDESEIKVGDDITTEIEIALSESDYIAVVLSPNSVESGWVNTEWRSRYWDEIEEQQIFVLPLLIEECTMPLLLKNKKYADFRQSYDHGFGELLSRIELTAVKRHVER